MDGVKNENILETGHVRCFEDESRGFPEMVCTYTEEICQIGCR